MKKCICILLTVILLGSMYSVGAVEDNSICATNDNLAEIAEYMSEMFALYFEEYVDMEVTVSIGNELSAYYYDGDTFRLSEYKIFPVIVNDSIIGMVDVVYENGDITNISVGRDYSAELNNAIVSEETAFAIIFTENGVYVAYDGGDTQIVKSYYNEDIPLSILDNSEITYESISQTYDITVSTVAPAYSTYDKRLNVVPVDNGELEPCCGGGYCWAASIAMIVNYYNGTAYNGLNIHNICGCLNEAVDVYDYDYHDVEEEYLRDFGLQTEGPLYSISYGSVYDCVENNVLMLLDLQYYPTSAAEEGAAHNVVISGYYSNAALANQYFYYVDPNGGLKMGVFPNSSSQQLTIPVGGTNFEFHCYITAYD